MTRAKIDKAMKDAVADGVFPAAELLVAKKDNVLHHGHYGMARPGMCFDIASLTKPLCTASLVMMFVAEELLKETDTLYQWIGGARLPAHRMITVEMLLNHTAGLPTWQPYYRELPLSLVGTESGKRLILDSCLTEEPTTSPGTATLYSDIGYMLLGTMIEEVGCASLDALFLNRIARPLGLRDTFFRHVVGESVNETARRTSTTPEQHVPTPKSKNSATARPLEEHRRFAPTEDCPWRERVVHGEVHDQNAYALGGVAGHAGLFSTASDLHRFILALTDAIHGKGDWIPPETVQRFFDFSQSFSTGEERYLGGWNLPSKRNSSAGRHFSARSIGHLGYTGCSMWVDLECEATVILLSNRVHPNVTNEKIKTFRPKIHDLVMTSLVV